MQIKNMFEKQIDRDIKGVIKVGQSDEENVYQELDEYVVTKELLKHFRDFFNNYEKGVDGYTDKMGVWISGFFGSGKSHFLKILSYLLKNSTVEGKRAIEYFTDGKKIEDPMLIAEMTKAGTIESDVMLFNIDSKGSAKVGSGKEAIVEVFMKVFNEMQGYCGSIPYLAEFERQLDNEGRFEEFKEKFEANAGAPWDKKRQAFAVIQDKVVKTLVEMDFMSEEAARNWCKNAKGSYDLSIEKFVSLVQEYCAKKGPNHHVIFLVDEIGQYIADDTQLMLNLQTIVEDLGTACKGKAWVIVTSQEDIDSITKTKGNDFSKIQGRFDTRLSLSASNVDEVIRKRVLAKNETATQTLRLLYEQKESIIKNLITFTADTADKKLYADKADFADCYPFIPYQFNLLGQVLTAVRTHGASREVIRNYFLNDFFKDHCNTYSVTGSGKRPIYWLFDSGKQNGFKALIYMHRYDADTVGRVRTDYLHKAQKYVETAMQSAQYTIDNATSASEKSKATKAVTKYTKQLAEMKIYDEAIAHVANQRIEIDLDDGVKVNYAKFQGVEVAQEGKKALKVDLLAKI